MLICPRLEINIEKIKQNTKTLVDRSRADNISIAAVTKAFCAIPEVVDAIIEGGVKYLADSRIKNLRKLKDKDLPKWLLRLPMQSQVKEVIKYADVSLNSELETIKRLSEASLEENKVHGIILMIDLGDLREGLWEDKVLETVEEVIKLDGVKLMGIGTNLTCYGGVLPNKDNLGKLRDIGKELEDKFNLELEIISGGNSSSLDLLENRGLPNKINNLRLGESIVLGREAAYGKAIEGTYQDAFQLVAEIVELKEKPTVPIGEIGRDAFGNKPVFEDIGIRKRAILAVGRQDLNPNNIIALDEKISIFGASSDHLIIDVTDSERDYKVGDEVRFNLEYGALLGLSTSEYVYKKIKK